MLCTMPCSLSGPGNEPLHDETSRVISAPKLDRFQTLANPCLGKQNYTFSGFFFGFLQFLLFKRFILLQLADLNETHWSTE